MPLGWLVVILGLCVTYGLYSDGRWFLASVAAFVTMANLWSFGVMHNAATDAAKRRPTYRGGFTEFTVQEVDAVPDWLARLNLVTALVIMLLLGIVIWRWVN